MLENGNRAEGIPTEMREGTREDRVIYGEAGAMFT